MSWKCQARLIARNYADRIERDAFRAGYSDGYNSHPMNPGDWPNAYSAGFHEGAADAAATKTHDENYKWWLASFQDDEHWGGPYGTRDEAVAAGRQQYGVESFAICEADKALYVFSDLFDGCHDEDLAEGELLIDADQALDRWSENDVGIGEDGWDGGAFSDEDFDALTSALRDAQRTPSPTPDITCPRAEAMSKAFETWAEERRPQFGDAYMFGHVRKSETIVATAETSNEEGRNA